MAQLNSPALSALNATVGGGRSEAVSSTTSNTPGEKGGFAEMMAGAIQNQNSAAQGTAVRAQTSTDAKAVVMGQASSAAVEQSVNQSLSQSVEGAAGVQQVMSTLQQQIDSLQEKIQTLTSQTPPLSDSALTALNTLTQQLASLKSRLATGSGSTSLDVSDLTKWMAQLNKLKTLLQQGDAHATDWAAQLQAVSQNLAQNLAQTSGQTDVTQESVAQSPASARSTGSTSSQSTAVSDAKQTMTTGAAKGGVSTPTQDANPVKMDNQSSNNQAQSQNNLIFVSDRNATATVSAQVQHLSGAIGAALSARTVNANSTLASSFTKENSKSDMVMQLTDPSTDKSSGAFNLSTAGLGTVANSSSGVSLPSTLELNQPRVAADLGQNIQYMVGKNISRATLDVNPAHLGPMKITIDQQNNQTNIQIMASHHMAKDMLDQNMPRLREWLQDAGLGNAQVTVTSGGQEGASNQAMNQGGAQGFHSPTGGQAASTSGSDSVVAQADGVQSGTENQVHVTNARWRLDTFA